MLSSLPVLMSLLALHETGVFPHNRYLSVALFQHLLPEMTRFSLVPYHLPSPMTVFHPFINSPPSIEATMIESASTKEQEEIPSTVYIEPS